MRGRCGRRLDETRRHAGALGLSGIALCLALAACAGSSDQPAARPQPYGAQPYPQQPYGAAQPYGAPAPGQPPPYGASPAAPTPFSPGPGQPVAAPLPGAIDPIMAVDLAYLRASALGILAELVAALPPGKQSRVTGVPMVFDQEPGEVNAFAACTEQGRALMAISDGLLDVAAHLAQAAANDELFGTRKVDEYVLLVAQHQEPGQPLVRPRAGFFEPSQTNDPRRIARQHALFEEVIAFVLGHELAHHYLGHLPCTASGPFAVTASELGNALVSTLPLLNQPAELGADVAGTNNVLTAGARRASYRWTETGGLLTMRFFVALEQLTPEDIVFTFERSHPAALVRQPVIQQTAATFRATGGAAALFPF